MCVGSVKGCVCGEVRVRVRHVVSVKGWVCVGQPTCERESAYVRK
jgi:hypothetical protein